MGGVLWPFTGVERVRICLVEGFEQRLEASDMLSSVIFACGFVFSRVSNSGLKPPISSAASSSDRREVGLHS